MHVTKMWIFASEDPNHDIDFHRRAIRILTEHYLHGEERQPWLLARKTECPGCTCSQLAVPSSTRTPRNFCFLSNTMGKIDFFVDYHFAATSHSKGCHDGIGEVAKNAIGNAELCIIRIELAKEVVEFLHYRFAKVEDGGLREYFGSWSPYHIRHANVRFIRPSEIYRLMG